MWNEMSNVWKAAFAEAWEAYCQGSIPIGAVIVDGDGKIVARGRNRINEKTAPEGQICSNRLAHAEINALVQINIHDHPDVKSYTLYTTMEPCPQCFGAALMGHIRRIVYAARDAVAGGVDLKDGNAYVRSKEMQIEGPFSDLELLQMIIKIEYVLRAFSKAERLIPHWEKDCPKGVEIGRRVYELGLLKEAKEKGLDAGTVIDELAKLI